MPVSRNEANLAKDLKRLGLSWEPKEGDRFLLANGDSEEPQFVTGEQLKDGGLDLGSCVWLPSWEVCREWVKAHDYRLISHSDGPRDEPPVVWLAVDDIRASGRTDLEAIYHVMKKVLEREQKNQRLR